MRVHLVLDECIKAIEELMAAGLTERRDIYYELLDLGFSKSTIMRACRAMPQLHSFGNGGRHARRDWRLLQ